MDFEIDVILNLLCPEQRGWRLREQKCIQIQIVNMVCGKKKNMHVYLEGLTVASLISKQLSCCLYTDLIEEKNLKTDQTLLRLQESKDGFSIKFELTFIPLLHVNFFTEHHKLS